MCGIAGFIDPAQATPAPRRVLRAMRDALTHRGPDDAGELHAAPAWLAHRRLAIVDPTPAGRQPFCLNDRVYAIANAEIYNHRSLRGRLRAAFPDARIPPCDCAVLPWLWELDGPDLARQLVGMHATAIWDARAGELCLTRDIAGQKPLYYAHLPGQGIAFASEPKALLLHPLVSRDVDPIALRRYLVYDYVPGTRTIYRQIHRLAPATSLTWRDGRITQTRYWDVPSPPPWRGSLRDASERLWQTLGDAVEARLMSDVPLGVFLSGGLDSTSLVAALAERMDAASIRTFAIGFDDPTFDESPHARTVARHFGTDHHEERLDVATMMELVPELLSSLDEPFADNSLVPTWLLCRFARRTVTVALGGEGGDELFLGYPTLIAHRIARLVERLPRWFFDRVAEPLAARLPVSTRYLSFDFKLRRFLSALDLPADRRHPVWIGGLHPSQHVDAMTPQMLEEAPADSLFDDLDELARRYRSVRSSGDELDLIGWQYLGTYLAGDILTKVDRASMAHGLELRAPFLDPAVIALAARLPVSMKLRGWETKRVMRRMLRGRVPQSITRRPKKGFGFPIAAWLRGELADWAASVLAPERLRRGGLLNPEWASRLLREHRAGVANHRKPLWSAIALELWRTGPHGPG